LRVVSIKIMRLLVSEDANGLLRFADIILSDINLCHEKCISTEFTEERPRMVERESTSAVVTQESFTWGLQEKSDLLLKLYEKSIDCMNKAVESIQRGAMVEKGENLSRAQDIVLLLGDVLEPKEDSQELASNLRRLYMYIYRLLIRGNSMLDVEAIEEARKHMVRLYSAWKHITLVQREDDELVKRVRCY